MDRTRRSMIGLLPHDAVLRSSGGFAHPISHIAIGIFVSATLLGTHICRAAKTLDAEVRKAGHAIDE